MTDWVIHYSWCRAIDAATHIWSDNLQLPIQRILHISNGFYTCSQSKISLLRPLMIGLKLTFTGCSGRWLPYMARGDFSCFLRSNSTQILIFGVNYSRDPTTRGEEFGCGFGFQKKWWESIRQDCVEYFCVSKHMIYWCNIIWVSGQNHYRTSLLMFLATLLICQARII